MSSTPAKKSSTGSKFVKGLGTFGKIMTDIRAVIATLLGIVAIVAGISVLIWAKKWAIAKATITQVSCDPTGLSCLVTVSFTPQGSQTPVVVTITPDGAGWTVGQTVNVRYLRSDPTQQAQYTGFNITNPAAVGWVLIAIGVAMIAVSWFFV